MAEADTALDKTEKQVQKTQKSFGGLGSALTTAAAAFSGIAAAQVFTEFAKGSVTAAANFEKLNISFATFLGSNERAKTVLEELRKFSAATPFTGEQVQNAGKALLAFGVDAEQLIPILTKIGDASSATGKDFNELAVLFGTFKTQGTIFSQDINQLTSAGIDIIGALSDTMGVAKEDVKKLAAESKISFAEFERAFDKLTAAGGKFNGLTEVLGLSFAGRVSTLQDNVDQLQIKFGTALLPTLELVVEGLLKMTSAITNFPKFVEENRKAIALLTGALAAYVTTSVAANAQSLITLAREKAKAIAYEIGFIQLRLQEAATKGLTVSQRAMAVSTEVATIAMRGFSNVLKTSPIGLIVGALTALYFLMGDFGDATDEAAEKMDGFVSANRSLADYQKRASENTAKEVGELNALFSALKKSGTATKERQKLIDEINGKYHITLENLTNEKKFVAQLDTAYQKVLATLRETTLFEARREELKKLYQEQAQQVDKIADAEKRRSEGLVRLQKEAAEAEKRNAALLDKGGQVDPKLTGLRSAIAAQPGERERRKQELDEEVKLQKAKLAEINKAIKGVEDAYISASQALNKTEPGSIVDVKQLEAVQKFTRDLNKELEGLINETENAPLELVTPESIQEQMELLNLLQKQNEKNIDLAIQARKKEAAAAGTLTPITEDKLNKIGEEKKKQLFIKTQNALNDLKRAVDERDLKAVKDVEQKKGEIRLQELTNATEDLISITADLDDKISKATSEKERESLRQQKTEKLQAIRDGFKEEEKQALQNVETEKKRALENAELTENEKVLIVLDAELKKLQIRRDFLLRTRDMEKDATQEAEDARKKRLQDIRDGEKAVAQETLAFINQMSQARIQESEAAITAQERRVDRAGELAEKGNAEILQAEEERLQKLNEQRAQFVRTQQALSLIELSTNSAVAVSKAAAQGGAAAPFTIAATLIALASGFIAARAQAQAAGSFHEGGYTGEGGRYDKAGTVHRGEFVFTQEKTRKYRTIFEDIHKGRDPFISQGMAGKVVVINSNGGMDEKLIRIERAIKNQKGLELHMDEKGLHGTISRLETKDKRIRNFAK